MRNRIFVLAAVISAVSLVSINAPAFAQQSPDQKQQEKKKEKAKEKEKEKEKEKPAEKAQPQGRARGQAQQQGQSQGQPQGRARGQAQRLPQPEQDRRVGEQRQRLSQYETQLEQQRRAAEQRGAQLQQQKRSNQYNFQQQYLSRLNQQQQRLRTLRNYNYGNDPYFYTPPSYRYSRGGRSYDTNEYGANVLKQAVNLGYEQGYAAGMADRQDRWAFSYQDSWAYQDGNYGYDGLYVDRDNYNYYFREGFRRGYDDGFYSRSQYGTRASGRYSVLGGVLSIILGLKAIR